MITMEQKHKAIVLDDWVLLSGFHGEEPGYLAPELLSPHLIGVIRTTYDERFYQGKRIETSRILEAQGRYVRTRGHVYRLGKINQPFRQWMRKTGHGFNWRNPFTRLEGR